MVRFTDRPDMTLDVYLGRKTTMQQQQQQALIAQIVLSLHFELTHFAVVSEKCNGEYTIIFFVRCKFVVYSFKCKTNACLGFTFCSG